MLGQGTFQFQWPVVPSCAVGISDEEWWVGDVS